MPAIKPIKKASNIGEGVLFFATLSSSSSESLDSSYWFMGCSIGVFFYH